MFLRFSRFLVFLAAVQILGGHWVALQSAAWVGMMAGYARESSLGVALEKTFDGEHPCALCQVVKSGQAEEKKREGIKVVVKLEAVLAASVRLPCPLSDAVHYPVLVAVVKTRSSAPPTRPPLAV